ncbi:MAG: C39 family peptidase [Coriobacteriales bacterium]|nr:C39 family peptidase [Coriobacteriales bacterium]
MREERSTAACATIPRYLAAPNVAQMSRPRQVLLIAVAVCLLLLTFTSGLVASGGFDTMSAALHEASARAGRGSGPGTIPPHVGVDVPLGGTVPEGMAWGTPVADVAWADPGSVICLGTQAISQEPELPMGCEITSATMMLNHMGYPVSKMQLDLLLPKSRNLSGSRAGRYVDTYDPDVAFIGDTRSSTNGCACNTGPVVSAINEYLVFIGSPDRAVDLTGVSSQALYAYVAHGEPVTIWTTIGMSEHDPSKGWTYDGDHYFCHNDHAMTLVGVSRDDIIVADPLDEVVVYPKRAFEQVYEARGRMAVKVGNGCPGIETGPLDAFCRSGRSGVPSAWIRPDTWRLTTP